MLGVFTFNLSVGIDQSRLDTKLDFDADQTLIYVDDNVVAKLDGFHTDIGDRITLTPLHKLGQHSFKEITGGN